MYVRSVFIIASLLIWISVANKCFSTCQDEENVCEYVCKHKLITTRTFRTCLQSCSIQFYGCMHNCTKKMERDDKVHRDDHSLKPHQKRQDDMGRNRGWLENYKYENPEDRQYFTMEETDNHPDPVMEMERQKWTEDPRVKRTSPNHDDYPDPRVTPPV